jgi:Fe-S cluster biogenesis protein NfuA
VLVRFPRPVGIGSEILPARSDTNPGFPGPIGSTRRHRGHVGAPARQNGCVPDIQSELSDAERAERLEKLQGIMDLMRPAVQADGGDLVLVRVDVETGVIEVQLQGACSSCAISSATLSGGVERILRERLPWVTEVIGGLDDSLSLDESAALGSGGYIPSL